MGQDLSSFVSQLHSRVTGLERHQSLRHTEAESRARNEAADASFAADEAYRSDHLAKLMADGGYWGRRSRQNDNPGDR